MKVGQTSTICSATGGTIHQPDVQWQRAPGSAHHSGFSVPPDTVRPTRIFSVKRPGCASQAAPASKPVLPCTERR